jgi:hypothetical protein
MTSVIRIALLVLLISPAALHAQTGEVSFEIILTPGDSLREKGDLYAAIDAYKKSVAPGNIFLPGDHSVERSIYFADTYNLACALSRVGQQDSALKYLELHEIASNDGSGEALSDPDLIHLRKAPGWPRLENLIIKNYCAKNNVSISDPGYAKALWTMGAADQAYYKDIEIAKAKTGASSSVVMALWDLKRSLNEENQRKLEAIIKEKGWPRISQVGKGPANAAFLVIQHADIEKQQKYLPVIKSLCAIGEAQWQAYALMYDRIQTGTGKPQRYGSQVSYNSKTSRYELLPLENAAKVDEWRTEAGLEPLSEYLSNWKISWP